MFIHGYTNPKEIIFDIAKLFCIGNRTVEKDYPNNWKLIYPNMFANNAFSDETYPNFWEEDITQEQMNEFAAKFFKPTSQDERAQSNAWLYNMLVDDPRIVLKCMGKQKKVWKKKVKLDIGIETTSAGVQNPNAIQVDLPGGAKLAPGGSIRVMIEGKKYSLYRVESITDVKVIEFYIEGDSSSLILPASCKDSRILVDFEEDISNKNIFHPYYLQLSRPETIDLDEDSSINTKPNYFYLTWKQGDKYDENAHKNPEVTSFTNWDAMKNYSIGDVVKASGDFTRYFKCKNVINRSAAGPSVIIEDPNPKRFTIKLDTTLHPDKFASTSVTDNFLKNIFKSEDVVINNIIYSQGGLTSTVEILLSDSATVGNKITYDQTGEHKLYTKSGLLFPSFTITLDEDVPTSWLFYSDPIIVTTPSVEEPLTGSDYLTYWEEVYLYKAEPAWLGYEMIQETKWSWYKCNTQTLQYVQDWLPIEYWFNIDATSAVAVIMGDPGMSSTDYLSSPAYFGQLEQIEGALETDDKGNFACFSGSDQNPQSRNEKRDIAGEIPRLKRFGDYTATGITDIMLTSSKSGRPFQGHKVGLFGMYEFKEQTFNGQSSHTNKHSVTDIVVADVHENERGILKNCLGVPKLGKEHGVELVADRYMANKEKTYIFLHINSLYTPFNTGNDVLIGIAIRTDN